jgi:hypothetical protein
LTSSQDISMELKTLLRSVCPDIIIKSSTGYLTCRSELVSESNQ